MVEGHWRGFGVRWMMEGGLGWVVVLKMGLTRLRLLRSGD